MDFKKIFIDWIKDMSEEEAENAIHKLAITGEHVMLPNMIKGVRFLFKYCSCIHLGDNNIEADFSIFGDLVGFFDGECLQFYSGEVDDQGHQLLKEDSFNIEEIIDKIINSVWDRIPNLELEKFMFQHILN
ncbi:MAG: hypothetical protein R3250_02165 [Melioribacteraceae bacterium]|nr:hypothetical protein [Melioribacteraceae bacterium]